MKRYAPILCILGIYILLTNCTKATVAQVSFSVSLASDTALIQGYVIPASTGNPQRSVRAKYFPLLIKINATQKAVSLYSKAQLYLKYQMFDAQGNPMSDAFLYEKKDNPTGTFFNQFFNPLAPNQNQPIAHQGLSIPPDKKTYNIVRISDTLSTTPYKIVFILVVKDSAQNESLPTITPKEAYRTLEVIIDKNNPNKASYILSYNKNRLSPKIAMYQEEVGVYWTKNEDYNLSYNNYLKIIS